MVQTPNVHWFDSVTEMTEKSISKLDRSLWMPTAWNNYETIETIKTKVANGELKNQKQVESTLDKINANVEVDHKHWEASMVGAYPSVPDYLSGNPLNMRRLLPIETNTSPVTIYVDMFVSSSISADDLQKKGIAIIALVCKLQEIRPIELVIVSANRNKLDTGDVAVACKLETNPISLAHLLVILGNPGFVRTVVLNYKLQFMDVKSNLPPSANPKKLFDLNQDTIWIDGAVSADGWTFGDPVAWVNQQVAKFNQRNVD